MRFADPVQPAGNRCRSDRKHRYRRRQPDPYPVDDQYRHERHRRFGRADRTDRRRRRRNRTPDGAGPPRGRKPRRHPRRTRPARMPCSAGGRHPFSAVGGARRGGACRENTDQPRQLQRQGRSVRRTAGHLQKTGSRAAYRRQPRFAGPGRHGALRRYARGNGRLGDGILTPLPRGGVRPGGAIGQIEQRPRDGAGLPDVGGGHARRGDALSAAPGRHRSGQRPRRTDQVGCGHRRAAGRRARRHDPRFADRSPRTRDSGGADAGGLFRRPRKPWRRSLP